MPLILLHVIPHSVEVLVVLTCATLIRSVFGFGEALVAVPLLALIMPIETAAPLATLVSITVAAIVLLQDWSEVHVRSAGWLVLSTLLGIPLGLLLLTKVAEPIVKAVLGSIIVAFSLYSLLSRRSHTLANDRLAWLFGFSAGILGGAYSMNGPPLAVYGTLRGWTPQQFRATLQGYFLPASVLVMVSYWLAGLWTSTVTRYYLISLPAVIVAVVVGGVVNRRVHPQRFQFLIYLVLAVVGMVLMVQSVRWAR
jgi:uncharacterized membrane protein YfcA